ncbi:unnamed protein product [Trifolium pratense]|uniref:Uncharacterized protein n=1 Tax=Trifolium pratense TaxID=57577 RepID=A0ACB0LC88_TRIPR|nr:unnamed protein product [Trifolium pratense]
MISINGTMIFPVQFILVSNKRHIEYFPPCFFSCHTLTSLHISVAHPQKTLFPNSLNFPALTSLSLRCFVFCVGDDGRVEPFLAFNRLKSLILRYCIALDKQNICISSATLDNLTIECCKFELCTPSLRTFVYKGTPIVQQLCRSKSNLSSVKHVNITLKSLLNSAKTSLVLHNWLVELANMESLTICSNTLEVGPGLGAMFKAYIMSIKCMST